MDQVLLFMPVQHGNQITTSCLSGLSHEGSGRPDAMVWRITVLGITPAVTVHTEGCPGGGAQRMRAFDRDLIRGGHYGQRSCEPRNQAEHMAAPTNAATVGSPLPTGSRPHMAPHRMALCVIQTVRSAPKKARKLGELPPEDEVDFYLYVDSTWFMH
jgi:hypothetical protein